MSRSNKSPQGTKTNVMSYLSSYQKQDIVKILPLKTVCDHKAVEAPHGSWGEGGHTLEVK